MLNKYRLCFTITARRSLEEISSYRVLLKDGIYQGIEIFYPYELNALEQNLYIEGIKELSEENPEIVLHLPFGKDNDLCNLSKFEEIYQRIVDAINFGKLFNVSRYTLHLGYASPNREDLLSHLKVVLASLCDMTSALIMIENMPRDVEMGYSPTEINRLITEVNKANLAFIFDIGHANVSSYSLEDYLIPLKDKLAHTHLSDNKGIYDEHKSFGYGNVDFKKFFKLTKDYKGLYCLEILYSDLDDLIENAKKFKLLLN